MRKIFRAVTGLVAGAAILIGLAHGSGDNRFMEIKNGEQFVFACHKMERHCNEIGRSMFDLMRKPTGFAAESTADRAVSNMRNIEEIIDAFTRLAVEIGKKDRVGDLDENLTNIDYVEMVNIINEMHWQASQAMATAESLRAFVHLYESEDIRQQAAIMVEMVDELAEMADSMRMLY